jgi:O-antigen/teichoic acid export membrane protein
MASQKKTISGKILHNSFWYGLETVLETIVFLGTSIAVARYLGPRKLGYYSYIGLFVNVVTRTSGSGLASATRKYMSEFLALDQPGTARAVYNLAYRYQFLGTLCITALSIGAVLLFGDPAFRLVSCILIAAIIPGVMSLVPAQANQAFEDVSNNTFSAFGYLVSYAIVIVLTVHFRWDLVGVASAMLVARSVEVVLRTIPLRARLRKMPLTTLPAEVVARIRRFCIQSVGIQLLMSVVWDRSEIWFLRYFSGLEQISFYSISFTLVNNLLVIPRTFGSATGISLMVESTRDPSRVDSIVKNACRYLLFVALPVHLGAAAIARSAVGFAYDARYVPVIPVIMIASILSLPRAFQEISEVLMRTADRQNELLVWLSVTGVVNIVLDFFLIRRYGAVGAAWGNGLSQGFGIMLVWRQARRFYNFSFPIGSALRLLSAASIMAVIAFFICRAVPGLLGLIAAVAAAAPIYLMLVKLFRGLDPSDRQRLKPLGNRLPGSMRRIYLATVDFITPAGA